MELKLERSEGRRVRILRKSVGGYCQCILVVRVVRSAYYLRGRHAKRGGRNRRGDTSHDSRDTHVLTNTQTCLLLCHKGQARAKAKADGTVKAHQKISGTQGGFTGELHDEDYFGSSVASLGEGELADSMCLTRRKRDDTSTYASYKAGPSAQ